jgi:hypothetical protein
MLVKRQSVLTRNWNTMELPVTAQQIDEWKNKGRLIQDVFPNLSASQRQFLMSGVTEAEWVKAFGDEDNINPDDLMAIAGTMGKTVIFVGPDGQVER